MKRTEEVSRLLPEKTKNKESQWCSIRCDQGKVSITSANQCRTLYQLFQRGLSISMDKPCLGYRPASDKPYEWHTYREIADLATKTASGLVTLGQQKGKFIGISSHNCTEWTTLALACDSQGIILCPLYDTLGRTAVKHILKQTELGLLVVAEKTIKDYLGYLNEVESVKIIVKIGSLTDEERGLADEKGVQLMTFNELVELGANNPVEPNPPQPEDIATICYTSGTTGKPKGVMITHHSLTSTVYAVNRFLDTSHITVSDVAISYLPAAHAFERGLQYCMLKAGGKVGFWQGDVRKLSSDMMELKPTVFACVPRIINRIYDKVIAEAQKSKVKNYLFNVALGSKVHEVENGYIRNNSMWDYLVFGKVQKMLGGRVRLMPCGAAPFKHEVLQFFRAALGAVVLEGYGQTECCGCCIVSVPGDYEGGRIGGVIPNCVLKLESVPEMGYLTENNQGEVCIKGDNVFSHYFKNEEKTKETIDEDGWLHTGDIGQMDKLGGLKIIDRKKNIFKLSQGEYVAPEKIETLYERCSYISQVCVYGNSTKNNLIAIVIPDEVAVMDWGKANNASETTYEDICRNKTLRKAILDEMNAIGKGNGLHSFELAKKIFLDFVPFSVDNDLMTPTFKLKRHNIALHYKASIDKMYETLD